METLSLREMIWLALRSAWADASLRQHDGPDPRIVHAERSAVVPNMGQWRERSAWSEEGIGVIPGIIRGVGLLGAATILPVHAERRSVRRNVPHGSSPESLRALAYEAMVVGVAGLRVGRRQHVQEGLARRCEAFGVGQGAGYGAA